MSLTVQEPKLFNAFTLREVGLAAGATATKKINVSDTSSVWILWTMTDATNQNDLASPEARFITPGGVVMPVAVPTSEDTGKALTGSLATHGHYYDVSSLSEVELRLTNGAGSARTVEIHVLKY